MINQEKKINKKSGFTLIETLVAVFIMTISITSLMTVVTSSLFAAKYTRDKVTATYLAQEAIDYIRNDRDTMVFLQQSSFNQDAWTLFTQKYQYCTDDPQGGCFLDASSTNTGAVLPACDMADDGCRFYFNKDGVNSFYNYNNEGVQTSFRRKIVVDTTTPDQMEAVVTISWLNGGMTRTISLKTSLMNW